MKNLTYGIVALLLLLLIVFTIQGCNKDQLAAIPDGKLVATKYTLNVGQPDTLLFKGVPVTDSIKWSVNPALATSFSLATKHNAGLITFVKSGTYTVSVADNGGAPVSITITVIQPTTTSTHPATNPGDTVVTPKTPITYTQLPLTGDEITLVPYFYKSLAGDSSYIRLTAKTKNTYCQSSTLLISASVDKSGNYAVGFQGVSQPSPCGLGIGTLGQDINFTQNPATIVPNGTFPLSVILNGTTYSGSIVATSSTITFNWNYTAGVLISPKSVSR